MPVYAEPALATDQLLASKLVPLMTAHRGKVAVVVESLAGSGSFSHNADEPMPTASLIKVAVMAEAMRQADAGKLDLAEQVTLEESDKVPGSGVLTSHFSSGARLSVRDAVRLMIAFSDNTATNLVLDRVGVATVGETMAELGLSETKIHGRVFRGNEPSPHPERRKKFGLGCTTANEIVRLFKLIHVRKAASEAACETMLEHLRSCQDRSMLARELPENVKFAHKSGAVSAVRCDAGILETGRGPVALCVLTAENQDRRWTRENEAERLCGEIGKIVFEHFQNADETASKGAAIASTPGPLKVGSQGRQVELLQRTLNARLAPSPDLSVDGEFGPVTEEAVKRFQTSRALPATGEADEATWLALSPVVTEAPPEPEPGVVNGQSLERSPPLDLDGPPEVTCKAWAVADAATGEVLWNHRSQEKLDFASTTKMMTAHLVVQLAREKPEVLDEEVLFSERADGTEGSTAGIETGERLSVAELLYGLMLPSGNDAAVALAEHFGSRFETAEESSDDSPYQRFVAGMNRMAQKLGMRDTHYVNPHGLTAPNHQSTAEDLVRLARAALQDERFRHYVQTRQHGTTVVGPGGYRRNVVWKNTNRLLEQEGFEGVKTGTTSAAGACLVSLGRRGDDALLVVVLGSSNSDARYVDARNLFRWAWSKR